MYPESEQSPRSNTVTIPVSLFDAMARVYYQNLVGSSRGVVDVAPPSETEAVREYKVPKDPEALGSLVAAMSPVGPGFEARGRLAKKAPEPTKVLNVPEVKIGG